MLVEASASNDLMPGVYRVVVVLDKEESALYQKFPFRFEMPDREGLITIPEREHLCVPKEKGFSPEGRFVKGIFLGVAYTDGPDTSEITEKLTAIKQDFKMKIEEKIEQAKQ